MDYSTDRFIGETATDVTVTDVLRLHRLRVDLQLLRGAALPGALRSVEGVACVPPAARVSLHEVVPGAGRRLLLEEERPVLINPVGAAEYGVSHVMATLEENTPCNIISRERRFYGVATEEGQYISPYYQQMAVPTGKDGNPMFASYIDALRRIKRGQHVIFVTSGASGRADFEVQWGMPSGTEGYQFEGSHVADEDREWVQRFCESLKHNASEITVHAPSRKDYTFNFTFATHNKESMGLKGKDDHVAHAIHNHTGATVVMLYLNIKTILKAPDERYYAALKALLDTLEQI